MTDLKSLIILAQAGDLDALVRRKWRRFPNLRRLGNPCHLSVRQVFQLHCGGVYFRFLPYGLVRQLFRRLNARGEMVVFYLHPWEIDAQQPRINLPAAMKCRHYWGLGDNSPPDSLNQKGLLGSFRVPMRPYPRRRCPRPIVLYWL